MQLAGPVAYLAFIDAVFATPGDSRLQASLNPKP